jgi:hypothetical protein
MRADAERILDGLIILLVFGAVSAGVVLALQRFGTARPRAKAAAESTAEPTAEPTPEHQQGVLQQWLDQGVLPDTEQDHKTETFVPKPESLDWFYEVKGERAGPSTAEAIRELLLRRVISNDTLVWNKTFGQSWKPIGITDRAVVDPEAPPPLPATHVNNTSAVPASGYIAAFPKLSPLLILALIVLGVWAYFGFASPDTLAHWATAGEDCVKFAEKNKEKLFFGSGKNIKAMSSWIKNGKVVVEIGAFQNNDDTTYSPRICVIGGGTIQIVSILESGAWR